jgi:integrase
MECDTPETLEVVKPKLIRQIKTRRLTLGLTGKALADQSGVSRASISEIENARHIPTLSTFSKLAGVLGITVQVVETDRNQQGRGRPRTKAPADLWAFFRLILLTGARPGEIIAATIFNYSRKAECITLKTHKTSKKTRKPRIIRLSKEACQLCDKLTAGRKTGPLLPAIDGGHVRRDSVTTVYRAWKDDKKEVRQHHHLNAFRHLWISNLLVEGVPIFEVSAMAGTSVREIERTYGHFCKRQSADAFRKLEQSHRASGIQ